ncbi:hypothetical protein GII30_18655 [Gordonia amarae]|uniref:Cytochrome c oxidase subunit IV n=2 Tax=Gordonia amarae TaxID=36821 RepID=G7GKC1_9ACTN|nr:cytochrome C oxidase subunit IV family protein [Gordonia amarae]MCS3880457.1 hypothetical protein [Gordonia amarae]QHN18788.1 hypothetical protein GII35_19015 [Gordonia amarae]QHN23263.1 hypothetical protein GII34_18515 [Gordonia amarae]QHN32165.1 hypothetical protein GII32_18825 [Gordonia amarae]QHN40911.1 hypothetical protein GII30_18655 [Gordonia amarae]
MTHNNALISKNILPHNRIRETLRNRYVRTWLVLVILAVVIPVLSGQGHGGTVPTIAVLGLSAYKARLVGLDFMELRTAPRELRLIFEIYCLATWLVLSGAFVLL